MKILVTGSAGFIGSFVTQRLLNRGDKVFGVDNHNNYYDTQLKEDRLKRFNDNKKYTPFRCDISDKKTIGSIFKKNNPDKVINLAAQAGVRFSMENPQSYVDSNIVGFTNILEACRHNKVKHLVYASSSSVYGANTNMPFSIHHNIDHPLSLYAASKKANELFAHTYSNLYNLPTTGLRFFTVYGPWGRPDMALFKFTKAILNNENLKVFNYGNHKRDFTYIDDIVEGVIRVLDKTAQPNKKWSSKSPDPGSSFAPWRVYNIGNNNPVKLNDYINAIEKATGIKAKKELLPLQPGDVPETYADITDLEADLNYKPVTKIEEGVKNFVDWYKSYYK